MKIERLVAAARWLDELEDLRAAAAGRKWAALASEFDDAGDGADSSYLDRCEELDATLVRPVNALLAAARGLVEARAGEVEDREAWPPGGSWLARAHALAKSKEAGANQLVVELELRLLRTAAN
jgi:hypothetical protein